MSKNLLAIVGPTASGKSSLAVFLSERYKGEIISADSRQIYFGINVGADQIQKDKMQGIPHYLLDIEDPRTRCSVVKYKKHAEKAIKKIHTNNKLPFLVGGTGMYIDTVIYNIQYPSIPENKELRSELEKKTTKELFLILQKIDPQRASTIDFHNKRRIIRAIEINRHTNKPIPKQISKNKQYKTLVLGIKTEREELYKKIEERFYVTLQNGHQQEVEMLNKKYKVSWKRIEELGMNYKYMSYYLQNKITKQEMIEKSIKSIQQYSKRQMVWFKKNKDIKWIKTPQNATDEIDKFIKK